MEILQPLSSWTASFHLTYPLHDVHLDHRDLVSTVGTISKLRPNTVRIEVADAHQGTGWYVYRIKVSGPALSDKTGHVLKTTATRQWNAGMHLKPGDTLRDQLPEWLHRYHDQAVQDVLNLSADQIKIAGERDQTIEPVAPRTSRRTDEIYRHWLTRFAALIGVSGRLADEQLATSEVRQLVSGLDRDLARGWIETPEPRNVGTVIKDAKGHAWAKFKNPPEPNLIGMGVTYVWVQLDSLTAHQQRWNGIPQPVEILYAGIG